jgi:hypothetical protein
VPSRPHFDRSPPSIDVSIPAVFGYDLDRATAAAEQIIQAGGWCVIEVCIDIPGQRWEPRVYVLDRAPAAAARKVGEQIEYEPERDARIAGCDRRTLLPDPAMGSYLCYLAPPHLLAVGSSWSA